MATMTETNPHELTNRWAKVHRYVKILRDEMGATAAEVKEFDDSDWEIVDRMDFVREGRKQFRPSSIETRVSVIAGMPELSRPVRTEAVAMAEAEAILEDM